MLTNFDYSSYLKSASAAHWKRIGIDRRSGVNLPLFSIYSKQSTGIGEIPDLKWVIDWAAQNSMSLIQLLPLNDTGNDFAPYNAESSFALDPMYLRLEKIKGLSLIGAKSKIQKLKKRFPNGAERVQYEIKQAKLNFLKEVYKKSREKYASDLHAYVEKNKFWIHDYALFKAIKEREQHRSWEDWPNALKYKDSDAIESFIEQHREEILFHQWLQWQLYLQMREIKKYAQEKNVFLIGDLPFLVSRDSADVWSKQRFFKLDKVAGAPPDLYFAKGQRWGMPTYQWEKIREENYSYIKEKLRYAETFYDLFRIDHAVGFFRVWSIDINEPLESYGLNGKFDPENEALWEEHGRTLLNLILESTSLLPCAEDLGVIPPCAYKVVEELAIPGMDVQRWKKDWGNTYQFLAPSSYRKNANAVISTHDMCSFLAWWQFEINTVDKFLFEHALAKLNKQPEVIEPKLFDLAHSKHHRLRWKKEIHSVEKLLETLEISRDMGWQVIDLYLGSFNEKEKFLSFLGVHNVEELSLEQLAELAILKVSQSASIFAIQMLQDWLCLDGNPLFKRWDFRVNYPGTVGIENWSLIHPYPLEKLSRLSINSTIRKINNSSKRR